MIHRPARWRPTNPRPASASVSQDTAKTDPALPTTPFYIADWEVHAASDRIRHGDTEIKLEPKVMAVLVCLADRHGELVTREQLEREVWGGTVVGYDALTSSIIKLRKALGDNSRHPRFIETVSKKRLSPDRAGTPRARAEGSNRCPCARADREPVASNAASRTGYRRDRGRGARPVLSRRPVPSGARHAR